MSKQALVIGGTGMLSDVSLWLNKNHYHVTVIGRHKNRYHKLIEKAHDPKKISSIMVDYHHTALFEEKIKDKIQSDGTFDLIVTWVHSTAPEVIPSLLKCQNIRNKPYDLYHVKSSQAYFKESVIDIGIEHLNYHEVYLGYKKMKGHSRWLTHKEIYEGVIDTIQHSRPQTVVGQIEPWEERPH